MYEGSTKYSLWLIKKKISLTLLRVQWLRLQASIAGAMGLILDWGTKIPYATCYGQKKKSKNESSTRRSMTWGPGNRMPMEGGWRAFHDKGRRVFCYPYSTNICNRTGQNFQKQLFHTGASPGRGGQGSSSACILWGWRAQLAEARMPGFQLSFIIYYPCSQIIEFNSLFCKME